MKLIIRASILFISLIILIITFNYIIISKSEPYLYDEVRNLPHKKTALVLGTIKGTNGINPYFKFRMEAAAELYFKGKIDNILVSGDNHVVGYDEPTDMANYLVDLGVPRSKITLDYAGFRTIDSVIRAKKVFNCSELIIVSQKFHNQRAVYAARAIGLDAVGYNVTDVSNKNNFTHYREIVSKFIMILDLHAFHTEPKFL
jgi:SanA protein